MLLLEQDLEVLAKLQDGWHDGDGLAISPSVIDTARQLLKPLLDYPLPNITPGLNGDVDICWFDQTVSCFLRSNLAIAIYAGKEHPYTELGFDLSQPGQIEEATKYLCQLLGRTA